MKQKGVVLCKAKKASGSFRAKDLTNKQKKPNYVMMLSLTMKS